MPEKPEKGKLISSREVIAIIMGVALLLFLLLVVLALVGSTIGNVVTGSLLYI